MVKNKLALKIILSNFSFPFFIPDLYTLKVTTWLPVQFGFNKYNQVIFQRQQNYMNV